MVARSLPQMPDSRGLNRTQSGPRGSGASRSLSLSGPNLAPLPAAKRPATVAAANLASLRSKTSAFIGAPDRSSGSARSTSRPVRRSSAWSRIGRDRQELARRAPDLRKSSMSQPRLRAMVASLVSGFTATGKPTASSIGRSDAESA